ncbi:MAG: hypothetical protein JNL88_04325 [Bacteroidia bacterium]|nr:hypothetical protein [Bacteroidia bacterium]
MYRNFLPFLFLLLAAEAPSQTWTSSGIGGGGAFFSPVISPHNASEIWLSSDMSGVYRSPDFGEAWQLQDAGELQGGTTVSIAFSAGPDTLYAIDHSPQNGTNLRRPVRSSDGGLSWQALPDPTNGEAYTVYGSPDNGHTFLLSGFDKIWYTNNGGGTYQLVYTFSNNGSGIHLAGAFFDGNDIYIGTSAGLIHSSNGGSLFIPVIMSGWPAGAGMSSFAGARDGNALRLYAALMPQAGLYAGITGAELSASWGIYSCNGTSTAWTLRMNGIAANDRLFFVACAKNDVNTVYAAGGDLPNGVPVVYKSGNGGALWNPTFQTTLNNNIYTGWSGDGGDRGWGYGEYALGLAVAPLDASHVVFTDLGFVHLSETGGSSWKQAYVSTADQNGPASNTPVFKHYHGIGLENTSHWWLCANGPQQLFSAASDINGIRSDDGGSSWRMTGATTQNSTYYVLKHPAGGTLYAATSTVHDLYQTTYLSDAKIDAGQGTIRYSSNNGGSWQTLHDFNHPVIWLAADPNNPNRLYASVVHYAMGVGEGGIWKTDNLSAGSASTWVKLPNPPRTEGHPFNVHVLNDGTLVAGYCARRDASGSFTPSSGVFVMTPGSNSWLDRSDAGMLYYTKDIVVDPADPAQQTWYACVWSGWGGAPNGLGGLYKTGNRGQNWTRIFSGADRVSSIAFNPVLNGEAWMSTETEGLWHCSGLQGTAPLFSRDPDFPFRQPERIFYINGEIWVSTFGGGLYRSGQQAAGMEEARDEARLRFENPNDGSFELTVDDTYDHIYLTDILGRYMAELPVQGGPVHIRASGGVYFICAVRDHRVFTKKMLLR